MTTTTTTTPIRHHQPLSNAMRATIGGLLVAAVGILIMFLALPDDFPTIPPGPIILTAAAAVVGLAARWWWSSVVGVAAALMIFVGNLVSGSLGDNFDDSIPPAVGVVVMEIGLVTALVAGVCATAQNHRR